MSKWLHFLIGRGIPGIFLRKNPKHSFLPEAEFKESVEEEDAASEELTPFTTVALSSGVLQEFNEKMISAYRLGLLLCWLS